jgi:hypothetical protein
MHDEETPPATSQTRDVWFDEAAGPLVRPYAVTRGRTRSGRSDLQLITLVVALRPVSATDVSQLDPEHVQMLTMCQRPISIAELSAAFALPLSVVKILLEDLIDRQLVVFRSATTADPQILQAVINGIRRL